MEQDVRLSMEQAHEKWMTKTVVAGIVAVLITGILSVYGCERVNCARDVSKAQFDAANGCERVDCVAKAQFDAAKAKADADKAMWDHMPPAPLKP
jgi:hypothetical protein